MRPGSDARDRSDARRRALVEISPQGRLAGYGTAASLVVVCLAYLAGSWDELTCGSGAGCTQRAGEGGLVWLGGMLGAAAGLAIAWSVHRRPVRADGTSGWTWGLAALFVAGAWLAITRIPGLTCPSGYHLDAGFRLCIGHPDRFDATDWGWLKTTLWAAAAVLGATVVRRPKTLPWSAAAAAAMWGIGSGWFLRDTLLAVMG